MKLEKVLDLLNSLEKNSFIKVIDQILSTKPKNYKEIEKLLAETDNSGLKNADNLVVSKIFKLVEEEFSQIVKSEFVNTSSQLDVLLDIIIRDGNCIIKQDWFSRLYDKELKKINTKIKSLQAEIDNPKSEISEARKRDYQIYLSCLKTAYFNDLTQNRDAKITTDELKIILTLAKELDLSQEEVKLLNYLVLPIKKMEIDNVVNDLRSLGLVFYSKKNNSIYVADEMVALLRKLRGKEIADKYFRRILSQLKEPQVNLICKLHNIDRKLELAYKVKSIINEGISFKAVLLIDIHKEALSLSEKKLFLNEFWTEKLGISLPLKGSTLEDKLDNYVLYFESLEKDDKVSISIDGYDKLLMDLKESLTNFGAILKQEFEFSDDISIKSSFLLDYNIKPLDILDLIPTKDLEQFCKTRQIKSRGNLIENILEFYKDSDNLYLENYINIANRDLNALKQNGIDIKEIDLGLKFEEITRNIFEQLGFEVDEKTKKDINTNKDKIDILLSLGNEEYILVECKTIKDSGYNKFSAVSRQMKAYADLAKANNFKIVKSLLIAPDFSDDFINETELEYELNLSLITANSLLKILEAFKNSKKHKQFPYKLLMRDVLIKEDRIIKAIEK